MGLVCLVCEEQVTYKDEDDCKVSMENKVIVTMEDMCLVLVKYKTIAERNIRPHR